MYNEDLTQSIAKAAQDVLEGYGKKKMKKEEMDPRDHVTEVDGKFAVVNKEGKTVKTYTSKSAAEKYAVKNHEKLMGEVAEPIAKGEKDFKAMHKVKKTGENEDGSMVKETKEDEDEEDLDEAKYPKKSKFPSHEYLPKSVQLKGFDKKKKKGREKEW